MRKRLKKYNIRKVLPIATMYLVSLLIYAGTVALTLWMSNIISLPSYLNSHIFTSIGTAFAIFLTIVLEIPKRVRDYVIRKLDSQLPKTSAEMLIQKSLGVDVQEGDLVNFDNFMEYRWQINYLNKTYGLANAGPLSYRLRIMSGGLFIIAGTIGLFFGGNAEDQAATFVDSWVFWLIVCSFLSWIVGFVIIWAGFLRALVIPIVAMLLIAIGLYIYEFFVGIRENSLFFFYILLVLLVIAVIYTIVFLFRGLSISQNPSLVFYEKEGDVHGTDLTLIEACPIKNYNKYSLIKIQFGNTDMVDVFQKLNEQLDLFCRKHRIILASVILSTSDNKYQGYLYYSSERQLNSIKRFLKAKITLPYENNTVYDEKWEFYKGILYPDKTIRIMLQNEAMLEDMEKQGFDLSLEYPVVFGVFFKDSEKAQAFQDKIKKQDYDKVIYIDNSIEAEENNLLSKYYHQIYIQRTLKLSPVWLNTWTLNIYNISKEYDGEYEWITLGEINETDI